MAELLGGPVYEHVPLLPQGPGARGGQGTRGCHCAAVLMPRFPAVLGEVEPQIHQRDSKIIELIRQQACEGAAYRCRCAPAVDSDKDAAYHLPRVRLADHASDTAGSPTALTPGDRPAFEYRFPQTKTRSDRRSKFLGCHTEPRHMPRPLCERFATSSQYNPKPLRQAHFQQRSGWAALSVSTGQSSEPAPPARHKGSDPPCAVSRTKNVPTPPRSSPSSSKRNRRSEHSARPRSTRPRRSRPSPERGPDPHGAALSAPPRAQHRGLLSILKA